MCLFLPEYVKKIYIFNICCYIFNYYTAMLQYCLACSMCGQNYTLNHMVT